MEAFDWLLQRAGVENNTGKSSMPAAAAWKCLMLKTGDRQNGDNEWEITGGGG